MISPEPALGVAQRIAAALADPAARIEVGNDTWGPATSGPTQPWGWAWTSRTCGWFEDQLDRVLVRHEASIGYSTTWWHNVRSSLPLAEHGHWYTELRQRAAQPYPEPLRRRGGGAQPPHPAQHPLVPRTQDRRRAGPTGLTGGAGPHGRAAGQLLDVLFAANRVPHPGEKRLVRWVERTCARAPADLGERPGALRTAAGAADRPGGQEALPAVVHGLIDDLDDEGLLP